METLENGLKVILRPIPGAQVLSTWVTYRVGSRDEVPGMTGATHWVEHMLFKGCGKLKKGDIDRLVSQLGGRHNAFTYPDFTSYFTTLPVTAMDTALTIEAERMRNAAFDPAEVEAERTVVISEREGAENQPEFLVEEELWGLAFHVHPYHWTPIGYKQDLASLSRDRLYDHYLRHYAPNNAHLVLVGGFDVAVAMQRVREAFGGLRPEPPPPRTRLVEPEPRGERRSELHRPGAADLLAAAWRIPPFAHDDAPALIVLAAVLGGWRGLTSLGGGAFHPRANRLYRALVDAKLATDVSVRPELRVDPSLLVANVTLAPRASLDRVEAVLDKEVEKLRKAPPSRAELDRAKRQVRAWHRYEQDGASDQGLLLSVMEALSSWDAADRLVAKVQRVRAEQVRDVARRYLVDSGRTIVRFHAEAVAG